MFLSIFVFAESVVAIAPLLYWKFSIVELCVRIAGTTTELDGQKLLKGNKIPLTPLARISVSLDGMN